MDDGVEPFGEMRWAAVTAEQQGGNGGLSVGVKAETEPVQWFEVVDLPAGASAPLLVAIREGGTTIGDDAFEHGLRTLVEGTTATLNPQRSNHPD